MKFTVITPSFNQAQFLRETIESVVTQTGDFEIEYFIHDGGSSDESVKIIKEYASKYKNNPRIKIHWKSEQDGGQVNAINSALAKSTGDIIAYINSDDYYLPKAFEKVSQFFNSHPKSSWVVGNCRISYPALRWTFWLKHIWPIQLFRTCLLVFNTINQPSVFLKKDLVSKVGSFDNSLNLAFDYDYWLRCSHHFLPGRIYTELSVFRIHNRSKGNQQFRHQFDEDWQVFIRQNPNSLLFFIHALARNFVKFVYSQLK